MKNKVLVAFSGGLDTTFCVKFLQHAMDMEVYTATVNTGGFSEKELEKLEEKARTLGSVLHSNLEETENYYREIVRFLVYGNILKNGSYPLSVSAERVHQAVALARYAKKLGVTHIAHGSTGAGNDQVRFDLVFRLLIPEINVLTPIRDLGITREEEIRQLAAWGVGMDFEKARYSINKGLWGTSVGGAETLTSHLPLPAEAYPTQLTNLVPQIVTLSFEKGELSGINGRKAKPVELIKELDTLASSYGIGRDIHVGDTIIGIKGRVGFQAAASLIIIKAHQLLEKHTLSKWQSYWKDQLSTWYGMFLHDANYFEPVMRNIEGFLEESQQKVSGTVSVRLHPHRFELNGIESENDLMSNDFGKYGEENKLWSGEDVKGFTRIMANPVLLYNHVNQQP